MSAHTFPNFVIAEFKCNQCGCRTQIIKESPDDELTEEELENNQICSVCHAPLIRVPVTYGTEWENELDN